MVQKFAEQAGDRHTNRTSLYIMIRPRGGDFCYSQDEIDIMMSEIDTFKSLPAVDGFVFGCLLSDGTIDRTANQHLLGQFVRIIIIIIIIIVLCCVLLAHSPSHLSS